MVGEIGGGRSKLTAENVNPRELGVVLEKLALGCDLGVRLVEVLGFGYRDAVGFDLGIVGVFCAVMGGVILCVRRRVVLSW